MTILNTQNSNEHVERVPDPVGVQQLRTRDKVFKAIGTTVDIGLDTGEFLLETAGYAAGRTIRAAGHTIRSTTQGLMGNSYRHAA